MSHTAIFDIGKTNKKCFLFDENYQEMHKAYVRFDEKPDDDGYPADDLPAIEDWIKSTLADIRGNRKFQVDAINFSTYGASFVHLDKTGKPLTPLYNYLKPIPEDILQSFYEKYGDPADIARQTASPAAGMLNSGFQLYWLKYAKPDVFRRIRYSLHFPQYLSYLFTGIPVSDFTSIGCHTSLWDYEKGDYHDWVYAEDIDRILPPIVATETSVNGTYLGEKLKIGVGIHDSSSALLPYLRADRKPFLLLSTGTWSIALNPFSEEMLTPGELECDCLHYMRTDGKPVKAARLFLGNEYNLQVQRLHEHFGKPDGYSRQVAFDPAIFHKLQTDPAPKFRFESIAGPAGQPEATRLDTFPTFEEAYHQLLIELADRQMRSARLAIGRTPVRKVYIDGGFADNDVFIKLITHHFPDCKLRTTQSPLGSALGAALVISGQALKSKFLKKHYALKKQPPLTLRS